MKLYEVYEGEYLKYYNLTAKQCAKILNVSTNTIYNASKTGGTVSGKYKIKVSHNTVEEIRNDFEYAKGIDYMSESYQRDFAKRWDKVCEPFRKLSKNKRRKESAKINKEKYKKETM